MTKGLLLGAAIIAQLSISLSNTAQAQQDFKKTADEVCLTVEQSGGRKEAEVYAGAEAKVNSALLRYLGALGVGASGKSKTETYEGVSQQELATVLRDARNCRLEVFKLMNKASSPTPAMATPRQTAPAPAPNAQSEAAPQQRPDIGSMLHAPFVARPTR
jgi:hypothetical protein